MINFKKITKVVNIFYLGGIAGSEGPLLNILKTEDDKYYFEYYLEDSLTNAYLVKNKYPKIEIPIEAIAPLHIVKETSLEDIQKLFNYKNLEVNENGPLLSEFFIPKKEKIYMNITSNSYISDYYSSVKYFNEVEFKETLYENKYIKKRFDESIKDFHILGMFNWSFFGVKSDNKDYILNHILENLK